MKIIKEYEFEMNEPFNLYHTFECGQCFRWCEDGEGAYRAIAYGREIRVRTQENTLFITCDEVDFNEIWYKYFDLERSYTQIAGAFEGDSFFEQAVEYGMGLRILAQEPWEALCTFIISQCNNINRIKSIVKKLCEEFGEPVGDGYAFPTAERLAALAKTDLDILRAGYRSEYILTAARAVAGGEISFKALEGMETDDARKEVMKLKGVGRKVADCFLLFGMRKYDAFPIDTWMKKAESHYDKGQHGANFGKYAGIAQQYIFYYARSGSGVK